MNNFVCSDCKAVDQYDINYTCTECGGGPVILNDGSNDCPDCQGLGVVGWHNEPGEGDTCPTCEGEGTV